MTKELLWFAVFCYSSRITLYIYIYICIYIYIYINIYIYTYIHVYNHFLCIHYVCNIIYPYLNTDQHERFSGRKI